MVQNFSISEKGKNLIKSFEGLRLTSYKCPAGILTIGYGHTGSDVKPNQTITKEQADLLFDGDLKKFINNVNKKVTTTINQNQFDALVSFAYNVGNASFNSSTLLRLLNQGKIKEASAQFERWVYAGKNKLAGLVKRRKAEQDLFNA